MANNNNDVMVQFAADLSKFDKAVTDMQGRLDTFSKNMTSLGMKASAALTAPLVGIAAVAIKEASNMENAMIQFNSYFKGGTDEMLEWVDVFGEEFPYAASEIISYANQIQSALRGPLDSSQAAEMTQEMLHLAAAVSTFDGTPIEDLVRMFERGAQGGYSRFDQILGVKVTDDTLKDRAMKDGLVGANEEMSEEVRLRTLLTIATENSQEALENYHLSLGSLTSMWQRLKKEQKDILGQFRNQLEPGIKSIVSVVLDWIENFKNLDEETKQTIVGVAGIVAAIGPLLMVLGLAAKAGSVMAAGLGLIMSPVTLVIAAIAGLIALFVHLYKSNEEFANFVDETWSEIKKHISEAIESIVMHAKAFWEMFGDDIKALWAVIQEHLINRFMRVFTHFKHVFGLISSILKGDWAQAWEHATGIFDNFIQGFKDKLDYAKNLFQMLVQFISTAIDVDLAKVWDGMVEAFKAAINFMTAPINSMINGLNNISVDIPNWVPGLGGESLGFNIPNIPQLAEGGLVLPQPGGVLANIAEGGQAEAVIPLDRLKEFTGNNGTVNITLDIDGQRLVQRLGVPLMREIKVRG